MGKDEQSKPKKKDRKPKEIPLEKAERFQPLTEQGLTAEQVRQRETEGLVNRDLKKKGKSYTRIFISNIFTFFNLIYFLVCATLVYFRLWSDMFFMIVILANTGIAIVQEMKSKHTMDKLSVITAPKATVLREGEKKEIFSQEIVLDDLMLLQNGRQICADAVVVDGDVEVNEAMLTGESLTVPKHKGDFLYAGSYVTGGNCVARADKIGRYNYIEGLTERAKVYKKPRSELLRSLKTVLKVVAVVIIPLAYFSFLNNYTNTPSGLDPLIYAVRKTAGTVIGIIPAGPFLLTSVALALGVIRLAKRHTAVQELYCIEMLARVNVLCLDKTGTLTDGTMRVVESVSLKDSGDLLLKDIVGSMMKAFNDNNLTSIALRNYFGVSNALLATATVPFSSERKFSAVSFDQAGTYFLGAPEFVLNGTSPRIDTLVQKYAEQGYRVLLLAHSNTNIYAEERKTSKLPLVRRPVALIVIEDHIREDAYDTIRWFRENDVGLKIISGDNPLTASEIAKKVGVPNADKWISLEGFSDAQVVEAAGEYTVFGRVTPDQKAILVKALKNQGETVAMTGDGVNDILALKEADCSIAMASGSEAARNVSHLVLLDSNFNALPQVVGEGRRVINNIQNATSLFFMKTIYTIVISVLALVLRMPYPYTTTQVILMEVAIVGIPTTLLAMQKNNNLIKGKFLTNVFQRAVPASLTFLFGTAVMYAISYCFWGFAQAQLETMCVLCMTYTALFALYYACKPFNLYRGILFTGSLAVVVIGTILGGNLFGFAVLEPLPFVLLVAVTEFCFPLLTMLRNLFEHIKID